MAGRFAFRPDPDGINLAGNFEVAFLLVLEVFHALEGGDEFAAAGVPGQILDGVAGREHGFVVEKVGDIGDGEHNDGREVFRAGLGTSGQSS